MRPITVIAEHGSHILVRRERPATVEYAVIERRNGQVCGVTGERASFTDDMQGMAAAAGKDWMEEEAARRLFREITERGEQLARRIW